MQNLVKALVLKLNTLNSLNSQISGRFYNQIAPSQEVFPYVLFKVVSEIPEELLDTTAIERSEIEFYIYSSNSSSSEAYDLYDKLISLLDNSTLSITGFTCVRVFRESSNITYFSDDVVWEYKVQYKVWYYKR